MKTSTRFLPRKLAARHTADRVVLSHTMRLKVRELVRDIREVVAITKTEEFSDLLRKLADRSDDIREAFIAWVELIELLVEECERNDARSGQGKRKKQEVKKTVAYILRSEFDIPEIPDFIETLIIDYAVDWTVDAVVSLVNDNDRFGNTSRQLPTWRERVGLSTKTLGLQFLGLFAGFGQIIFDFIRSIRDLNNYGYLPQGRLLAAADRVKEANLNFQIEDIASFGLEFKTFIGHNSDGITAIVRLTSGAVKDAQLLSEMTNEQRKQHAVALIEETLNELDLIPPLPFLRMLLPYIIDFLIEASYEILKKRVFNT